MGYLITPWAAPTQLCDKHLHALLSSYPSFATMKLSLSWRRNYLGLPLDGGQ